MMTPTFEVKIIISPIAMVFLITTLAIQLLGYTFSISLLILISSTKKSQLCFLLFANHSDGRDLMMPTLIPIG